MNGWKTIVFFTLTGLLGLVTALEAIDLKAVLLPLVCHVPANAQIIADECTGKLIQYVGYFTAGVGAVGVWLRTITTTSIFKSLKDG